MYSVSAYGKMIADAPRMDAYVSALRQVIKPGSVVLDLGSGPGLFALIACQLGAGRVYAVEPDNVIQLAREGAAANRFADRIEFIQDFSNRVSLPEQADVIVSDLRGVLPWFQQHIPSIRDARTRLLAPGGVLIPQRDTLWAAIVEMPDRYAKFVAPWEGNNYGFDLTAARRLMTNTWEKGRITPDQLLVQPVWWQTLDYYQVESPDVRAEISWSVTRAGTAHGISVWFDSELVDGIGFSNAPGNKELIYGNALFPFSQPVEVTLGDQISVVISADLVSDDYVWRWDTHISGKDNSELLKANFSQSTFSGVPLSPSHLRKRASNYIATLNDDGQIDRFVLSHIDGKTSSEEIARELTLLYPGRFASFQDALTRVGDLAEKYGA